ncbi:MAG: nicotinate-nucleotide adenylyltransferase [Myxococcota bacterium]
MRIGVYGGSFNPPHVGHLLVSDWLLWTGRCDEVWWIPVRGHPFSVGSGSVGEKNLAPFEVRLELCRAATQAVRGVVVSDVEGGLPLPSYTIDTLDHLAALHPTHALRLVVGADVLDQVGRWKAWDRITAGYAPIVVGRQGWPTPPGTIDFPGVSSTEIRRRCAAGEPIDALVPAAIAERVRERYSTGLPPTTP